MAVTTMMLQCIKNTASRQTSTLTDTPKKNRASASRFGHWAHGRHDCKMWMAGEKVPLIARLPAKMGDHSVAPARTIGKPISFFFDFYRQQQQHDHPTFSL
ncbi:hypothetical protein TW95_gp1660 [Pandoravirus inopinatum]|uniref:Uncharacterized protein n=1 Tax=Pandoravirus inopinatum TaxID=1605721 RepID=A0A0B5J444_9VIRU|nr:hypothetical protein TW95_gp1660 [Pandoravirus inopinatum]AJF98394.1 hypothetical protein [Pandoravirus inopinatum]